MKERNSTHVARNADARRKVETATAPDGAIVLRIEAPSRVEAPDDLIPFPFGLEAGAARKVVRDRVLRAARIGRRLYARRSDVLALVDKLASPAPEPSDVDEAYRAVVDEVAR